MDMDGYYYVAVCMDGFCDGVIFDNQQACYEFMRLNPHYDTIIASSVYSKVEEVA